jgi:hypothetical protein
MSSDRKLGDRHLISHRKEMYAGSLRHFILRPNFHLRAPCAKKINE